MSDSRPGFHTEIPFQNRMAASLIYVLQYSFPEAAFLETLRQANVRGICKRLRRRLKKQGLTKGPVLQVERRCGLSDREFVREYMNKSVPVLFEGGALDWDCTRKWSLDYFAKEYGDRTVSLVEKNGLVEREFDPTGGTNEPVLLEELRAKDFVASIRQGSNKYLRFAALTEADRLISDLNLTWLQKMRRTFFTPSYLTFIGAGGRTTPLHAGLSAFFFVLAEGEKKWTFYSPSSSALIHPRRSGRDYNFSDVNIKDPDLTKYPGFELLTRYECHMKKGDILWCPSWCWHEVENLTESWAVRCGFGNLRTFLRYPSFVFVRLFLIKPSIFLVLYHNLIGRTQSKPSLFHHRLFSDPR